MSHPKPNDDGNVCPDSEWFALNGDHEICLMAFRDGDMGIECDTRGMDDTRTTVYATPAKAREIGHALIAMADSLEALLAARTEPKT